VVAKFPSEVGQRLFDLLSDATVKANVIGSAAATVAYGDQDKLPTTPTVCVETGNTTRPLSGVRMMVTASHTCYILVYHGKVQSIQVNKKEGELCAERIAAYLDANLELRDINNANPLVIHGWCTEIDPGYAIKNEGTLTYAVRITWQGISKYQLGA
jgi:hypothetical protein